MFMQKVNMITLFCLRFCLYFASLSSIIKGKSWKVLKEVVASNDLASENIPCFFKEKKGGGGKKT